jgi:L-malate glycosyltransferase
MHWLSSFPALQHLCSMSVPRRILFISTNPAPWGGSEEMWYQLAKRALKDGHKVMISVFKQPNKHSKIQKLERLGASIHLRRLPGYHSGQSLISWIIAQIKLRLHWHRYAFEWNKAWKFGPDHLFISGGETLDGYMFAETYVIRKAMERRIPYSVVGHFHHEYSKILSAADRASKRNYLRNAAGLYFVSHRNWQMTAHDIQDDLPDARIIFNPILEINSRKSALSASGTMRMAFVARLECEIKCQDLAINTLAQAPFRSFDFVLDIFGEGPDMEYLENLIRFHGLERKIHLKGHHESPGDIWENHDLLVLTSRGEGTPLVILEAMRAGVPALVTRVGDSALWINNERGYVAEAITIESLTETFMHAFKDRKNWGEKGRKCRAFFNVTWTERHMEDLYDIIWGKQGKPGIPASDFPQWLIDK